MARIRLVRREYSGRLAASADAPDGLVDERLHPGICNLAGVAERGVQVRRPDEHSVDALYLTYRLQVVERSLRFDLYQDAQLLLRALGVVLDAAEARGARGARHAARPAGGITGVGDGAFGFGPGGDVRYQDGLCTDVEHPLDGHHVVPRHAHHAMRRIRRRRLQLGQQVFEVVGGMLAVEQQPVEAGAGDHLDGVVRRQARPQPDLRLARAERALEEVRLQLRQA